MMKTCFKEGRSGYAFKDGKLYWFDKRHVLVMTSWPDPRAWFKRRSHNWRPTRKWADELLSSNLFPPTPDTALDEPARIETECLPSGQYYLPGFPLLEEPWHEKVRRKRNSILGRFFDTFPGTVRAELLKYNDRKWHVLNMLARCPGAFDLSHSNPALLYALASNWVFHKPAVRQPIRAARSLMNKKQKRILAWLGFPGTEPVRRILSKIRPQALSIEALLYLRGALDDPFVMKWLSHLEHINAAALRLATDHKYRSFITPRLLEDVSMEDSRDQEDPPVLSIFLDTLKMSDMIDWHHCPKHFISLQRLREVHDELALRLRPDLIAQKYDLPARFDDPPFPGTVSIRPIVTLGELFVEGDCMCHCVGMHAVDVAQGNEYVYRVLSPVRATLSIVHRNGRWMASELFKAFNEPVDEKLSRELFDEVFNSVSKRPEGAEDADKYLLPNGEDSRQLPLLDPAKLELYMRCVRIFEDEAQSCAAAS